MPLYRLGPVEYGFPPATAALDEPNGLLAVGGDLSPERLLLAYRHGIFPWFNPGDPVCWWSPDPRCVFRTADWRPSRSLSKRLRQGHFTLTVDRCFTRVMEACAAPRAYADGTWIQPDFIRNYGRLHEAGHAHSIEAWNPAGELVGGLYGLNLGRLFFGESMFSRETDASKAAFAYLMQLCRHWDIPLVDGQVENDHLLRLGAVLIPREDFLDALERLADRPAPDWRQAPPFSPP
ncbi:MAG TPA: leucyl/phenylalanyl-tRNA--protein transferase [Moraxellaceae bacterium]|nr:leucyl/phenylalanyl-tRNA--protein transferase [Moraxellaceae bacterium]